MPKIQEERDASVDRGMEREALFYEKMQVMELGMQMFESLLASFLTVRLGPEWQSESARIGVWLNGE